MKKIITLLLIIATLNAKAQDSTEIKNFSLTCKLLEYITPQIVTPDNDSLFQVFLDLRAKFMKPNPPVGNDIVIIDSIKTVDLASIYNYTLSNSDGIGYGSLMRNALVSQRAANSYLNNLCNSYEDSWQSKLALIRQSGRRLLRGK